MDITKLAQFKSNKSPVKFTIKQNFFISSHTILYPLEKVVRAPLHA